MLLLQFLALRQTGPRAGAMPPPQAKRALRFRREWGYGNYQFSPIRPGFHVQSPAQRLCAFADRAQTYAGRHAGWSGKNSLCIEPHAVIADAERELAIGDLQRHDDARGPRMPRQVG